MKMLRGSSNIFRHPKGSSSGASEKIVGLEGGLRKFVSFKTNTCHHHTNQMVFISTILMTYTTQLSCGFNIQQT